MPPDPPPDTPLVAAERRGASRSATRLEEVERGRQNARQDRRATPAPLLSSLVMSQVDPTRFYTTYAARGKSYTFRYIYLCDNTSAHYFEN